MSESINAEWLAERIENKRDLRAALAVHLGLDRPVVENMMTGHRVISQDESQKIQDFFANHLDRPFSLSEEEIRCAIAARLREARRNAGYTDAKTAASAIGVTATTYRHHENGTRGIRAAEAVRYAQSFRFSLDWLYTGKMRHYPKGATSSLPLDAKQGLEAFIKSYDASLSILVLSRQERKILNEAAEIFTRLYEPDPKRSDDVAILSRLLGQKSYEN